MIRNKVVEKAIIKEAHFRWRSDKVTRLEGFSDAVFAFAMTLLVVSLEVPKTFDQLMESLRGFLAFAICFTFLVGIWYTHYNFFRRYGIIDRFTIVLNATLLFLVLFYVYPLKFLFTWLINQLFGITAATLADGSVVSVIKGVQVPTLMMIYSAGYIAVFLIFMLLYHHAYRKRDSLELTEIEIHITRESVQRKIIYMAFGVASICLAMLLPMNLIAFSGLVYVLISPIVMIHAIFMAKARKRMVQ